MADVWILCEKNGQILTAVAAAPTENQAKDTAGDGDYVLVPVRYGRLYPNLVDESMIGAVAFTNISLYATIKAAKKKLDDLEARIIALEAGQ